MQLFKTAATAAAAAATTTTMHYLILASAHMCWPLGRVTQVLLGSHLRPSSWRSVGAQTVVMGQTWRSFRVCKGPTSSLSCSTRGFSGFLASRAPHSGGWMLTLPISVCGLRLDDEAVRVALRLGIDLGCAHICRCGANVDPSGIHSLVCRHAPGRATRNVPLSDCIFRALGVRKTSQQRAIRSGRHWWYKRPDGCTLIPWCSGKSLPLEVTAACSVAVISTYLQSFFHRTLCSRPAGCYSKVEANYDSILTETHISAVLHSNLMTRSTPPRSLFVTNWVAEYRSSQGIMIARQSSSFNDSVRLCRDRTQFFSAITDD